MKLIETSGIPADQLGDLERFAQQEAPAELRDLLLSLSECIRNGSDLAEIDGNVCFTPAQVAQRLGMSRTHVYKLLDQGVLPYDTVGRRDRRIRLQDVIAFEMKRQSDRRELAERFAAQQATRDDAVDEIAGLLA